MQGRDCEDAVHEETMGKRDLWNCHFPKLEYDRVHTEGFGRDCYEVM